jgi:hypothetical protein
VGILDSGVQLSELARSATGVAARAGREGPPGTSACWLSAAVLSHGQILPAVGLLRALSDGTSVFRLAPVGLSTELAHFQLGPRPKKTSRSSTQRDLRNRSSSRAMGVR